MANKFIESLQQSLVKGQNQTPLVNQTETVQTLSNAKSGKSTSNDGPRISNVGEQLANQQTLAQLQQSIGQQQVEAQKQEQQADEVETQLSQRKAQLTEQTAKVMDDYLNQSQALVDQLSQGLRQLNLSKDKSKLEQLGFVMRMSNDQYIDNLQREGARNRLDSEIQFNEALTRAIFAEEQELFENDLRFRAMLAEDDREFKEELSYINLDFAMQMATAESKAANAQMMWTGAGNMASAGAKAYANSSSDEKPGMSDAEADYYSSEYPSADSSNTGSTGTLGGGV